MVDLLLCNNTPMLLQIILKLPFRPKHMVPNSRNQHSILRTLSVSLASKYPHIKLPDQLPITISNTVAQFTQLSDKSIIILTQNVTLNNISNDFMQAMAGTVCNIFPIKNFLSLI